MAVQPRTIVLAYDGSDSSQRALEAAADLVGYGSTLTVVGLAATGAVLAEARERLLRRHVLAHVAGTTDELGDAARAARADLLVVGRGAASGSAADALGSVVRSAPCDLLIVN